MKKKKLISKVLAIVLVLSLMLSAFPSISVFAQELSSKEKLTEKGDLWQPESNSNMLNFEGDLSLEELQSAKLSDEDTPEIVGQDNIEEKGHVNRLWEQEEDLNSIVFQNRDGTKTMYYYNYPVKYKDANGKIKDKSNKISQTSSGDFTNAENDINTYFPKKLNRNKGIELKFGEYVVEMAPDIKGNSGASRQTGHNKYFDPTEYVQYPNVFDESISLRYTPTFEGYKEDIVLSKYTGINEFSFRLYTDGLSLVMNEDGAYYLIDPLTGEVKTLIGDLVVYDSKPFDVPDEILNESVSNPTEEDYAKKEATLKELIESVPIENSTSNELLNNLKTYSHQYRVETVKQDSEYRITVVVDEEYLTDSERVYPVYVDPTISVSGSGTGKTIQDAPIYANKPSTASGGNTYNVVGYQGSTYGVGRTLMKFPGLSSNSTYANLSSNQITSLQLHIYEGSGSTNNACIDLWQYNGTSWTESTARCNNVGWDSYSNNFTWNFINCSGWQTFNLTSMVATWKSSSTALNKGIMLKNYTSESSSGYSKHFMSTESSYKPYLTYTYNVIPTQVTLSKTSNTIGVGDSFNLYATVSPSNTSQSVVWSSSDSSVATVSSGGLVCANGSGTTVITARSSLNSSVYATCTVSVNKLKIYQTRNTYRYDENGNLPEDLEYNDISENDLRALDWINWLDFAGTTATHFRYYWEDMCVMYFAKDPLQDVILDMIDHFMEGTGSNYSNSTLTNAAYNHESTQTYINNVKNEIDELLDYYNGDITALMYYSNNRDTHPLVSRMSEAQITEPVFNTADDRSDGLTICVDSLWGNEIEVKSYNLNGSSYSGTLTFTLYDHFGLDEADVSKYGFLMGFRSWYILQHSKTYSGTYKPFVSVMQFDVQFSGTIN